MSSLYPVRALTVTWPDATCPPAVCDHAADAIANPGRRPSLRSRRIRRRGPAACSRNSAGAGRRAARPASARPPLDVFETDEAVEIAVDLPGVDADAVRVVAKGRRVLIAGEKTPRRGRGDVELSPGRARLRPLRARRPPHGAVRHDAARARRSPTASCASSLPKIARAPRPRRSASRSPTSRPIAVIRLLFIGDIVGRPGRDLVRRGLAALVDAPPDRSRHRQRRERRGRLRHHARDRRPAARLGRRRDDLGQSHLGQEGSARLHRRRAAAAAAGQLSRPACRATAATSRGRADGAVGRRDQRHGPRVHAATSTTRLRVVLKRDRGAAPAHARHLRGLPRRGDVREDRDGLASRRQGHGGRRHAHARADGRRADPAEGHRVSHRRRHDRPARLVIGVEIDAGARPVPERACRRGSRPPPAIRG